MDGRDPAELLAEGEAFADLSFWRKIAVSGGDAFAWLNDLVSADISDLGPGHARRSLLLSPTGRVRAEFTVAVTGEGPLLLQDPLQSEAIDDLLARYVLSSDVTLEDRTQEFTLLAFPGRSDLPHANGAAVSAPSCLGRGFDLLAPESGHDRLVAGLERTLALAGGEDVEAWRIRAGIPRFGVDGTPEDLPQECGFEDAIAFAKGCYLGQEAMAKVRNLGHPRRVLVHLESDQPVSPGQVVTLEGSEIGEITGAASLGGRTVVLARVAWDARRGPFETALGGELRMVVEPPARQSRSGQAPAR